MNNVVPHRPMNAVEAGDSLLYQPRQLQLIRDTAAKDCNDQEFELFISGYCRPMRLNPLRKQIYAFVFGKTAKDQSKRQMSVVIAIDGFRAIAARSGNYRPGETTFEVDESKKDPLNNPEGLVSATVSVWQFSHGQWFEIKETAWWSEQAPTVEDGDFVMVDTGEKWPDGNPKKRKQFTAETRKILDTKTQWPQRGRTMLAKCAEAKALRRGWPEDFSNVYGEEEVAQARAEQEPVYLSPSEAVAQADEDTRRQRAGLKGDTIFLDLMASETAPLQPVPVGEFADKCMAFISANRSEPSRLMIFRDRNTFGLREFWAKAPKDCNAVKKALQDAIDNPPAEPGDEQEDAGA
jgi:phage recombination protein Bet